jgi:hypothetical protein
MYLLHDSIDMPIKIIVKNNMLHLSKTQVKKRLKIVNHRANNAMITRVMKKSNSSVLSSYSVLIISIIETSKFSLDLAELVLSFYINSNYNKEYSHSMITISSVSPSAIMRWSLYARKNGKKKNRKTNKLAIFQFFKDGLIKIYPLECVNEWNAFLDDAKSDCIINIKIPKICNFTYRLHNGHLFPPIPTKHGIIVNYCSSSFSTAKIINHSIECICISLQKVVV